MFKRYVVDGQVYKVSNEKEPKFLQEFPNAELIEDTVSTPTETITQEEVVSAQPLSKPIVPNTSPTISQPNLDVNQEEFYGIIDTFKTFNQQKNKPRNPNLIGQPQPYLEDDLVEAYDAWNKGASEEEIKALLPTAEESGYLVNPETGERMGPWEATLTELAHNLPIKFQETKLKLKNTVAKGLLDAVGPEWADVITSIKDSVNEWEDSSEAIANAEELFAEGKIDKNTLDKFIKERSQKREKLQAEWKDKLAQATGFKGSAPIYIDPETNEEVSREDNRERWKELDKIHDDIDYYKEFKGKLTSAYIDKEKRKLLKEGPKYENIEKIWEHSKEDVGKHSATYGQEDFITKLIELEGKQKYTGPGLEEAIKNKSAQQFVPGLAQAFTMVSTSVAPTIAASIATGAITRNPALAARVGQGMIASQIVPEMYVNYNRQKAEQLFPNLSPEEAWVKLHEQNKNEFSTPVALSIPSFYLEKVGIKGITKAINKGAYGGKGLVTSLWAAGGETGTELGQLPIELYNEGLGKGLKGDDIGEFVWEGIKEQGVETALQSFFGTLLFTGGGKALNSGYKAMRNHNPEHTAGTAANSLMTIGVLKQNQEFETNPLVKEGLTEAIKIETKNLRQILKESNDLGSRLTPQQLERSAKAQEKIDANQKKLDALKDDLKANRITKEQFKKGAAGFRGAINNANQVINRIVEEVKTNNQPVIRNKNGTLKTKYSNLLEEIREQTETRSTKQVVIDEFKLASKKLNDDFKAGKLSQSQYNADRGAMMKDYATKLKSATQATQNVKKSVQGVKESSIKASTKLQEIFDKGVKDGDITKDKDGKNVIGDKSMKQILDTQLPFIKQLTNSIWNSIPKNKRIKDGGKEQLESNITSGAGGFLDLLRTYNGSVPLGAYLQEQLRKRAVSKKALEGVSNQQFQQDMGSAEVQGIISEEDSSIISEIKNIETAQDLEISKNLMNTIKNAAKKALLTTKQGVDNLKFKSDIAKSFKDDLYNEIKKELGLKNTKKNKGLTKAIKKNPVTFYNALSVESMRMARTKDGKNPFEEAGFLVRNKDGVLEKKKYNQELGWDFLDYFVDPNLKASTRSDRQMNLVEALATSMGAREAISLLENDIEFRQQFAEQQQKEKDKNIFEKAVDKIKSIPKGLTEKLVKQLEEVSWAPTVNAVTKILGLSNKITVTDANRVAKQKANVKAIEKGKIPSIVFVAANFSNFKRKTVYGHYDKNNKFVIVHKSKRNKEIDKKYVVTTSNEYILESSPEGSIEARSDWQTARGSLYYGVSDPAYETALKAAQKNDKEYPNLKKPLRITIPKDQKITKEFIKKYQERAKDNMNTLESFATILQDAVHEYKVPLEDVLLFVSSSYQATSGLIKVAAPFKYVSKIFEYDLKGKTSDRTGAKYREEHNPPASVIGATLMWAIANNKVGAIMPSIRQNYYQTQLSKKDDGKIDRAKLSKVLPKGFTIIDNPIIRLAESGIDLNSIVNPLTGKTLAQENNVESPDTVDGIAASNEAAIENNSDQVENLIDRAIAKLTELTGSKGTLQMNLATIPVQTIISALRTVKLAYQGGKLLAQAIDMGYKKIKDYMSAQEWADFVSKSTQEVRNQKNPANVKLAILSERGVAQMQEQSRKEDEKLLKEFGIDIEGLTTDQIVEKLSILRKAKSEASNTKNPTKKARVFDFDDTLAKTDSKVLYTLPDGTEGSLDATQFAEQYNSLKEAGATFDYSEFNQVKKGSKGPLANLAKRFTEAVGDRDVFVLTARPAEAAEAIQEFLRSTLGISIPLKNITGLENGTPGAKAMWIAEKVSEGYNDIFFADDSKPNVDAVEKMLTDLGVTKRVQQAKEDGQKTLEDEMDSLVRTNKPSKLGRILNKFNIYIPPGADDFAGLLSYFVGSGKKGEQQQKWFKDNLLDPFGKGINAWTSAKVSLANDYKELKKRFKNKKLLAKKVLGGLYTNEQAVRAYLYDKAGQELGLNKADAQDLIALVEGNPELKAFADEVSKITKLENGYPNITKEWLGGNIDTDMANAANTSLRQMFLQDFINNKNQIFSEQNLKLIKQAYGNDFVNALENILERMTTGINRKKGKDKEFNTVMNWINQSVGAVMALNMRSAILQQLSIVNYTNWSFNNPFMMAKAMANVPQFLQDYVKIWNSPFLQERRGRMSIEVNMEDIADSNPGNLFLRLNKKLLELGFKPTQWGDSNAISFGGASWYRNRVNRLIKEGATKEDAEAQAMVELRELSEEHQQSSRPDRISRQQSSDIGRLILAFANTPLQLARSTKKAVGDLIYRRGDPKTNASKIIYYGMAQSIIFAGLQQGLFSLLMDDDDELDEKEKKKLEYGLHSVIDGLLRGVGFAGATVAALKNLAMEYSSQQEKRRAGEYVRDGSLKLIQRGLSISPPVSKKIGDIVEAQKFETWRQYKNDPFYQAFAYANYVSGLTNLPVDRVFKKIENLKAASDARTEAWQSIFLSLGWSPYNVGVQWPEMPPKQTKKPKNIKNIKKIKKIGPPNRLTPKKIKPLYKREVKILGKAHKDGTIEIASGLSPEKRRKVRAHEEQHGKDMRKVMPDGTRKLDYSKDWVKWNNNYYERTSDQKVVYNGKKYIEGHPKLPWEIAANKAESKVS